MIRKILIVASVFTGVLTGCGQIESTDARAMTAESEEQFIITGQNTVLKISKDDSATLTFGSEKCNLPAGRKLTLSEQPRYDANHYLVNLTETLPDCQFKKGYVFVKHISKTSLRSEFTANVRAFLDTIGYAEGTDDRYDIQFTFTRFYSYADHPRQIRCSGSLCSDAAGRYQFLSTTWDNLAYRLALRDFTPESQDKAAVQLLKDAGVYSTVMNISSFNDFSRAAYGVATTWASFPGSPYGQPTYSASQLYAKFEAFVQRY
ncbi:MAG: hypothetical protein RLZZ488_1761 [Pseudomonadota bacterium]|jgi:muramidase (phage lysozyme)